MVARAELPEANYHPLKPDRFDFDGHTFSTRWLDADSEGWQFFRLSEGNLASVIAENAKSRNHETELASLVFDYDAYPFSGQLGDVQVLRGRSGFMRVAKASVKRRGALAEELLLSCVLTDGTPVSPETADRILTLPVHSATLDPINRNDAALTKSEAALFVAFGDRVRQQNLQWLDEEEARLDAYAEDIGIEIDARIAEIDGEITQLRKQRRLPATSVEEKLRLGKLIKSLEGSIDDLKLSRHERRRSIRRQVSDMLDEAADSLAGAPKLTPLFSLRWQVR